MDENKVKQISYRPDLKYTDEYESNLDFNKYRQEDDEQSTEDDSSIVDDLLNQGEELENLIDKLPDSIGNIIKDPTGPIFDFVNDELSGKDVEKVPVENDWTYNPDIWNPETPDIDDENNTEPDNPTPGDLWDPDDFIPIEKEEHTKEEIIQKEYIKNLYDLFEDYYTNLQNIVSKFWSNLLLALMGKNSSEIKLVMDNILLSSSDVTEDTKHLLDFAVKSDITRNMKLKYFSTNFDAEESIKHLKQFKAMYELRLRYCAIDKVTPTNNAEQISNNVLKAMNLTYDLKYDKAYEGLYRYLRSSNSVLEDSLNTAIQSIKAKQALVERNGIK